MNPEKALLCEIILRAVFDYVLYRHHTRLKKRVMAMEAFVWLYLEKRGHPDRVARERDGWETFSFEYICDSLQLDPDKLRARIRKLKPRDMLSLGRPPTKRKLPSESYVSRVQLILGGL